MSLGGLGGDTALIVDALRAVTGVADAEILPDEQGGPGTLRLQLAPGADEVLVATTVHRVLGERFGLGVDAGRVQVVEESVTRRPRATGEDVAPLVPPRTRPTAPWLVGERAEVEPEPAPEVAAEPEVEPVAQTEPDAQWEPELEVEGRAAPATEPATEPEPVVDVADRPGPRHAGVAADPLGVPGAEPDSGLDPARRGPRLLIHRMQLVSARDGVTSEVTLELSGAEHTGSAGAATTTTSVHRAVALATLRAVEEALGGRARFELEHLETTVLGGDRAVVVEVSMITRIGSERLTGVSSVREDARQAVIRATLDALNRRIDPYLLPV